MHSVDPFIGTAATDLPAAQGPAATWWWPKAQVGNTHPGACHPLGMVSACACSGAYPTGYGRYGIATEGAPQPIYDDYVASGFTHFQQSGTGAIRKYYNYFRVTPMLEPLDALGTRWRLRDETAAPGYYAATLETGIRCELTVGEKTAVHRYTFPETASARVVVDFSYGGLAIEHGTTVPLRAGLESLGQGRAQGTVVMEGVPLSVYIDADTPGGWRQLVWYDRRRVDGGTRLDFDYIRRTTLRPFGLMFMGPLRAGATVEIRMGFSMRGTDQARRNLEQALPGDAGFDRARAAAHEAWSSYFSRVEVHGGTPERRTVFATALYHSLIKPCFAEDESPFWPSKGPFVFDIATMWDMYKTQFPLLTALDPAKGADMLETLVRVAEEEGNLPIGYRMARGSDRFFRQASALAHTVLADGFQLGLEGLEWDWALVHMQDDLRRGYGEDYAEHGLVHPVAHTLDLATGYWCTAIVARGLGDHGLADELEAKARGWTNAFGPDGLLRDSSFYEGGRWNYSFRLLHDMAARIALTGGDRAFTALLDRFFGYGAAPVTQLGAPPFGPEFAMGLDLDRFEGLNNEPDMEAPWAYHYAGRPDRTAEIVHAALAHQFGTGRGGLPGNDDSGALSSWYVWASLGLFPVAGQNLFLVNAPAFAAADLRFGGNDLELVTTGHVETGIGADAAGGAPRYVRSARFNGRPLDRGFITGNQLHGGGRLEIDLGPEPSDWARKTRPPSASDRSGRARSAGTRELPMSEQPRPSRRLVIVVRADPVICGHATEARGLAEVALTRGFDDVRIVTWTVAALEAAGLPLKPLGELLPYSPGITVERPGPVGDYRVPDGRHLLGLAGRLFELFTDGVPTVCMSMYLSPHTDAVIHALRSARACGLAADVTTVAEAVGSDITNVVRSCIARGDIGAAASLFATYLANDRCVAVSAYTRDLIVEAAEQVDAACGTRFAGEAAARVQVSYPAVDAAAYTGADPAAVDAALAARGLERDGYLLFLSRVAAAKGADDLIAAYRSSRAFGTHRLVIAGTGPALDDTRALAAGDERVLFLTDVSDEEKPLLMNGCAAYALPSKPRPEFVETFGIALVETMLAGGGPVITTRTGGIPEAVGDHAIEVPHSDPAALAAALDRALATDPAERAAAAAAARDWAMRFDRAAVFDGLFAGLLGGADLPAPIG